MSKFSCVLSNDVYSLGLALTLADFTDSEWLCMHAELEKMGSTYYIQGHVTKDFLSVNLSSLHKTLSDGKKRLIFGDEGTFVVHAQKTNRNGFEVEISSDDKICESIRFYNFFIDQDSMERLASFISESLRQ